MKHHLALNILLIAVAASNFNPVASQPAYSAFTSNSDLQTAVDTYCDSNGGAVDETYG